MIKFDNVSKRYTGGHEALSAISFEIGTGEMAFITGRSGAGKSSLLKLILAMERASTGALFVDGVNINRLSRRQIAQHRRKIGAVFQDHQLLFDRCVFDNVALPLEICGYRPWIRSTCCGRGACTRKCCQGESSRGWASPGQW